MAVPFESGEPIMRSFETRVGKIEMIAEAIIKGDVLVLNDIAVYPEGVESLSVGTGELIALLGQLKAEFREMGFRQLRILGTRFSGAKPGRSVDIKIKL